MQAIQAHSACGSVSRRAQGGRIPSHSSIPPAALLAAPIQTPIQHQTGPASCCNTSYARPSVAARASKLDSVGLFADSSSFSGPEGGEETKSKATVDDVPLESEVGMDYTVLRDHLKAGDFRKADDETRALLIRLAGEGAIKRSWVYFTEVKNISVTDFITMDTLWRAASNGKFGYSTQREVFNQNQKRWPKFFKSIDWTAGEFNVYRKWPAEFIYSLDAPKGHLPLTNALRGTQLFEAVLGHPAWNKAAGSKVSIDDSSKAAGKNTLKW